MDRPCRWTWGRWKRTERRTPGPEHRAEAWGKITGELQYKCTIWSVSNQPSVESVEEFEVRMVAAFVADLAPAISSVRLEAHRPPGGSDLEMLVNYYWNIDLCKSLYPAIHALEISLRNSIHTAIRDHYGTPFWFDLPDVLLSRQLEMIKKAREDLDERGRPQTPDDIVAALMLGFWVTLFNKPFELPLPPAPAHQLAWHDAHSRPSRLFQATFPHAPNAMQSRRKISRRCNSILWLRNRVMHHETIWKYDNLADRHAAILEMIGWINPTMQTTIAFCDDFPMIHAGGKAAIEAKLRAHLGAS